MSIECTTKLPMAALAILIGASSGFAQIRYQEFVFDAECSVWIDASPEPLSHSDMETGDEWAEAEAEIRGAILRPHMESLAETFGGTHGIFTSNLDVSIEDGSHLSAPARWASGSWSHHAIFDVEVRSRVQVSVDLNDFRDIDYTEIEPCTITGPAGVVVSGSPEPGRSAWTWVLDLPRGRYTYEAGAAYRVEIDGIEGVTDSARHVVRIADYGHVCRADLDEDDELTIFDFLLFQNFFDAGDMLADFDDDEALTLFDFLAFQNQFDAGCE